MAKRLEDTERAEALRGLTGWSEVAAKGEAKGEGREAIHRRFVFADFNAAFGWMTRIAMIAETMNHHPEWTNVYRTVDVTLTTHDAGGLSRLDIELARAMDRLAE